MSKLVQRTLPLTTLLLGLAAPAMAQDKDLVPDEIKTVEKKDKEGWNGTLSVGATVNFIDNRTVVGQNDGSNWTLGAVVNGSLGFLKGKHEYRGSLSINENFSRTTLIPEFINTADAVFVDSNYYLNLMSWIGIFARAELQTNLFSGYAVYPEEKIFLVDRQRDDAPEALEGQDRFLLRDPLGLVTLKQSVGGFIRPLREKYLDVEIRLGVGARQVIADGQFNINDNKDTPEIEIKELENFQQIGAESALVAKGTLSKDRVAYKSSLEALFPFYNSINPNDKGIIALTNVESVSQISFKLVEWASLDYQLRVLRQPLLSEDWQVQNSLLLTFGYTLIDETR